jgi:hypothetical protein
LNPASITAARLWLTACHNIISINLKICDAHIHLIQVIEHCHRPLPVDTCIGNANTPSKTFRTVFRNVLPSFIDVGLDHHSGDMLLSGGELGADVINDPRLIIVILL